VKNISTVSGFADIISIAMFEGLKRIADQRPGFRLMELAVGMAVFMLLCAAGVAGSMRMVENGRKSKALSQFRDFQMGMSLFEGDYQKPPIPRSKRDSGWDTIYGDPDGNYSTQFLVAALAGEDREFPYKGETFSTRESNPQKKSYMVFQMAQDGKYGIGPDGRLLDPWGGNVIVAINGFKSTNPSDKLVDFDNGRNDRRLHTWGLAEYHETKPKDEAYVFLSYGKDGQKGKGGNARSMVPLKGSDDVVSW
jgi:type II secretory pathway pseudopilin PulG